MPIEIESPEELGYDTIRYNLAESSFRDGTLGGFDPIGSLDLRSLVLGYGDHLGNPELRAQIITGSRTLTPSDVTVTPGAAAALFIVATTLLDRGDRVVVAKPNYATNLETPYAIGADIATIDLRFDDGFRLDLDRLADLITPATRYVSLTDPHNPTGTVLTESELEDVIALVESRGCYLLLDETYRDLRFGPPLPLAADLSDRAISVSSMSKAYGLPGIRIGWLITRDPYLQERFLAAKEQMLICGSTIDEAIAAHVLSQRDSLWPPIRAQIDSQFATVQTWMQGHTGVEWVEPGGGVVGFPRLREHVAVEPFYRSLTDDHATMVGPGHWFDQSRRHFRLGFGWPTSDELIGGLAAIDASIATAITTATNPSES